MAVVSDWDVEDIGPGVARAKEGRVSFIAVRESAEGVQIIQVHDSETRASGVRMPVVVLTDLLRRLGIMAPCSASVSDRTSG